MAGTNLSSRDGQLGPGLIGGFVTLYLFGILTAQCYSYFRAYEKDKLGTKLMVGAVLVLDTFHCAVLCHAGYFYFVKNYGNPDPFKFAVWSLIVTLMLNIIIAFVVQLYFTACIHDVSSHKWWLTIGVSILVVTHAGTGMANVVDLFVKRNVGLIDGFTLAAAIPWAATSVLSDIVISTSLCYLLSTKRTGFKSTNKAIDTLMIFAVNRCILTCAVAILEVICFVALPNSLSFIGVDLITGKLYSNSLLATLNSRTSILNRTLQTSSHETGPSIVFSAGAITTDAAEMFGVSIPERPESRAIDLYHRNWRQRSERLDEDHMTTTKTGDEKGEALSVEKSSQAFPN